MNFVKTGDIPLNFNLLIAKLLDYKTSFVTLNFAQQILVDEISKGIKDKNYNVVTQAYKGDIADSNDNNIFNEPKIVTTELQKDIIGGLLKENLNYFKGDSHYVLQSLCLGNYHFIRTKFVNSIFEIFKKYIGKHTALCASKNKQTALEKKLFEEDWYVMLFILRNNASHEDGLNRPFKYPEFLKGVKKDFFIYKSIVVDVSQKSHLIRYNNDEIMELYEEMYQFIISNQLLLTSNDEGLLITDLVPAINLR